MGYKSLDNSIVLSNLDKKNIKFTLSGTEQYLEFTLGQVHSVAKFNLLVETNITISGTVGEHFAYMESIKNIYVCPNGMVPALNLGGLLAKEVMKQKFDGANEKIEDATGLVKRTEFFSFDFRDYMGMFPLGLPEEAKDLSIKITINPVSSVCKDYASATLAGEVTVSLQLIQDESINDCIGYRRYFTEKIGLTEGDKDKVKKINLPRFGFLDSMTIYNPSGVLISDLVVSKDEVEFPVKSTLAIEKANARLINKDFREDITYIDLVRPIDADMARTLNLEISIGTIGAGATPELTLVYEYVHLIPEFLDTSDDK